VPSAADPVSVGSRCRPRVRAPGIGSRRTEPTLAARRGNRRWWWRPVTVHVPAALTVRADGRPEGARAGGKAPGRPATIGCGPRRFVERRQLHAVNRRIAAPPAGLAARPGSDVRITVHGSVRSHPPGGRAFAICPAARVVQRPRSVRVASLFRRTRSDGATAPGTGRVRVQCRSGTPSVCAPPVWSLRGPWSGRASHRPDGPDVARVWSAPVSLRHPDETFPKCPPERVVHAEQRHLVGAIKNLGRTPAPSCPGMRVTYASHARTGQR
jgi:hypothetical protein